MTTHFTDREKQIIAMALVELIPKLKSQLAAPQNRRIPINEFDTLKHSHALAHLYTAFEKVSGKPPTPYFQNRHPSQIRTQPTEPEPTEP